MPCKTLVPMCAAIVLLLAPGCDNMDSPTTSPAPKPTPVAAPPPVMPQEVQGTIAEHALVVSGGSLTLDGYGLVIGLGKNGSSECPPAVKAYLVEYLQKSHLGSTIYGTRDIKPDAIIRDLDTAVVIVRGDAPPGAPAGTRFDVTVAALPQSQTRNLDGGLLMVSDLRRSQGPLPVVSGGRAGGKELARGGGYMFLNPFLDPSKSADQAKARTGRIIGGGLLLEPRPLLLQLYQPDHGKLRRLRDRINDRFSGQHFEVAKGVGNQVIELKVPPSYYGDIDHFVQLVMHLPLVATGGQIDQHAQRVAKMLQGPTQRHEDLAMVLEAMGRQIEPILRSLYTSDNPYAQYFAARTGMRLGDTTAAEVVMRHATSSNSKFQIQAIQELGRHRNVYRATGVLRDLLDDDNNMVRLAAYESLLKRGDASITTIAVDDQFKIDLVPSRDFMIYARQTGEARIALFGKQMPVQCPMFHNSPDDLLTVSARKDEKQLTMYRKVARSGQYSSPFQCSPLVSEMTCLWGKAPELTAERKVTGMGLTYGQVVASLYRMCKEGNIPARFVLQEMPDVQKMSEGATGAGRPDLSE
jgi:hypothetical protein